MRGNYEPVPLSSDWAAQLNELSVTPSDLRPLRGLVAALHTGDILIERFNAKKRNTAKMDVLDKISCYYFPHCYTLAMASFELIRLGYGHPSDVMVRGILESAIDLAYLWLCKLINGDHSNEREAWGDFQAVTRGQMHRMWGDMNSNRKRLGLAELPPLFDASWEGEIDRQNLRFKEEYRRRDWALRETVLARARAVDETRRLQEFGYFLEEDYVLVYKWTSQSVHGSSLAAGGYMQERGQFLHIEFGPSGRFLGSAAAMTSRFLLLVLHLVNHINHLGVDIPVQLAASGFDR